MNRMMVVSMMFLAAAFCSGPAVAQVDFVDIGNPDSEAGHNLQGWGPIEPENSGGNYGGIDDCRAIYAPEEYVDGLPVPGERWATLDLDFGDGNLCLTMHHLDGLAVEDAFEVYVYPPGQPELAELVFAWEGDGLTVEIWYVSTVSLDASGVNTVEFVSTAEEWPHWEEYGQMCFDLLIVEECEPVAADGHTWGSVKSLYR